MSCEVTKNPGYRTTLAALLTTDSKKFRGSNRAFLTQTARAHPEYSANDLRNELQERREADVRARTVQLTGILSDSGYT